MSTIPSLICGVSGAYIHCSPVISSFLFVGCDKQTDIVLRSSDGVLLGAHAADLARYSKDLLQYEDTSRTEDAATLGILLVLFHPRLPPPALDELSPSHLIALAEATEKYAALPITQELCRMAIRYVSCLTALWLIEEPYLQCFCSRKPSYPECGGILELRL